MIMTVTANEHRGFTYRSKARIPATLQSVFLASNRGIEVHVPPPKVKGTIATNGSLPIRRGWLSRRFSNDKWSDATVDVTSKSSKTRRDSLSVTEASSVQTVEPKEMKKKEKSSKSKSSSTTPSLSPQQYLDAMVGGRGYSVQTFSTLTSAYHNQPTPLQLASYGTRIVGLVRGGQADELAAVLATGLSANPCNSFGESLLHNVCRLGNVQLLNVMMQAGSDVQVCDDCGRTPMHDACWAAQPAFDVVEKLLQVDIGLLYMADARGALPLSYIRKEHWSQWLQFLVAKKDIYWPKATASPAPPPLALLEPNSRPVQPPAIALSLELARLVANGRMTPEEAIMMRDGEDEDEEEDDEDGLSYDSSYDESYESSSDDDEASIASSKGSWNEDEMNEVLNSLSTHVRRPLVW